MFFFLSKILSFLLMPTSWIVVLFLVSFIWKKRAKSLRIAGISLFFLFTNPLLFYTVNSGWGTPTVSSEDLPDFEVGVVMGGFAGYDTVTNRVVFGNGTDRFNQGLHLLQTKKIDRLILSGGSGFLTIPELKESIYAGKYADEIGIPMRKVWIESNSRNTHENAIETKKILKEKNLLSEPVLLITSSYHMKRSMACFKKQGINAIPFSVESMSSDLTITADAFVPSPNVLMLWHVLMHEWIGYFSYWLLGYI